LPGSDDWRLRDQADYLQKARLRFLRYNKLSEEWDHDHCVFCWAKIMDDQDPLAPPDSLHEGYATSADRQLMEDYYWICVPCFDDFKEQFEWHVQEGSPFENI
jgi:hypothetical protein